MNRPFPAFGVLLSFLALTMFAVSSTSRSTTIKPAASNSSRAAVRRQAALNRLSALASAAQDAFEGESLDDDTLCVPESIEFARPEPVAEAKRREGQPLKSLEGPTNTRLAPVQIEAARDEHPSLVLAQIDGRTGYDRVYDRVVLGFTDAKTLTINELKRESNPELSATDVAMLFHSVLSEKSPGSRNATGKSQRRASLEGVQSLSGGLIRAL